VDFSRKCRRFAAFVHRNFSVEMYEVRMKFQATLAAAVGTAVLLFANVASAGNSLTINGLAAHVINQQGMFYPPPLIRLGVSGRMVLAYSVRVSGQPEKITVLASDDSRLERPAIEYLGHYRFDVPKSWEADAGQWRRFHLEFSFTLEDDAPRPKLVEDGDVIVVTARTSKRKP
jgi:Gram-negative bacterial TonB protein C-terminal